MCLFSFFQWGTLSTISYVFCAIGGHVFFMLLALHETKACKSCGCQKIVIAAALAGALFHPQTHPPNEDGFAAAVYV